MIRDGKKPNFISDDFSKLAEASPAESTAAEILERISAWMGADMEQSQTTVSTKVLDHISMISLAVALGSLAIFFSFGSAINLLLNAPGISFAKRMFGADAPSKVNLSLPYLFAYGTSAPSYQKIRKLHDAIKEELEK